MIRNFLAVSALIGLAACGDGNPFTDGETVDGEVTPSDSVLTGEDLDEQMTANNVEYDDNGTATTADDTLVINNLPFDNSDLSGGTYTRVAALPNGFEAYESPAGGGGTRQYFAVFRRAEHTQATATATNDYIGAGFGGVIAERLGSGSTPDARPSSYVFTGEYAGLRVYRGEGLADATYVIGDATVYVDVLDFDEAGAVEGIVNNREVYSLAGAYIGDIDGYLSLATASIDQDTATASSSTAVSVAGSEQIGAGEWSAVFGGPNGEELAGIVVIDGSPSETEIADFGLPDDTTVRENGVFIVFNGG
ncbi:hypothetical protein E4Z66_11880 [Aliishimia ponticola]|uniref:Uncharacterized protein n=1 Tax=Aliishimia ponticola TaxID=2499833 RepID=A0A4S4NCJ0_9RHOB|nr:hypothetical protein [Aliishimia ponticola]THH35778.1 hypothetical protein E4Z66_11880 [Aliishimia ponticola]